VTSEISRNFFRAGHDAKPQDAGGEREGKGDTPLGTLAPDSSVGRKVEWME